RGERGGGADRLARPRRAEPPHAGPAAQRPQRSGAAPGTVVKEECQPQSHKDHRDCTEENRVTKRNWLFYSLCLSSALCNLCDLCDSVVRTLLHSSPGSYSSTSSTSSSAPLPTRKWISSADVTSFDVRSSVSSVHLPFVRLVRSTSCIF